jgi:polyferredoxin
MKKVGRPTGLIAYDNDVNIHRRLEGKENVYRLVRPRTVIYSVLILVVAAIMLFALVTRSLLVLSVLHDRNPVFVTLSDGSIRNAYTVRLLNKRPEERMVELAVEGLPNARMEVVGLDSSPGGKPRIAVGADQTRELRVLVTAPPKAPLEKSTPLVFRAVDVTDEGGASAAAKDNFIAR